MSGRPGLRLAVTTFTVLPLPGEGRAGVRAGHAARNAMLLAPVVGLALGLVAAGVLAGLRVAYDSSGPATAFTGAVAALAVLALLSRGLHLDGLADTADGLGCYGDRDRALVVMAGSEVGAFGVVAVAFTVLLQAGALAVAVGPPGAASGSLALVVAVVTGRLAVVWACARRVPSARPGGLGALVAGTVPMWAAVAETVLAAGVLAAATLLLPGVSGGLSGAGGALRVALAVLAGLVVAWVLRRHAVRRFGGVTGDVLGALLEVATTVALLALAA